MSEVRSTRGVTFRIPKTLQILLKTETRQTTWALVRGANLQTVNLRER